jgi:F-type H+-transporting ATPase subunit b
MRRAWLVLASCWIALPALAEGAAEAAEQTAEQAPSWVDPIWGVPMIAWQIVNILLVVVLFVYLLRRPAPKFFADRAKEIQDLLLKAVHDKEEATARLQEVEAKMAHLKDEVEEIEKAALAQAEVDKQRVQAEAEQARERIRQEAKDEIERRLVEARRDLRKYAADAAVAAAREALARGITAEDESRLRDRFLADLEEEGAHERGR